MRKWFLDKYLELVFWWKRYRLERQLEAELRPFASRNTYGIFQDDNERKYAEGLAVVKNKINNMSGSGSTEDYESVLQEVQDLIKLGTEETSGQQALRKILTNLSALPEKSRKKIIDERIGHYKELHEYNDQRALIREIKQARKDDNEELAQELETKWREKYGKIRNPRRR